MEIGNVISNVSAFSSILLYMTGWPLVFQVYKRRSTADMSTFPYIAMLTNCSIWIIYGILTDNLILKNVNIVGFLHQLLFIIIFYTYSKGRRIFNRQILASALFIILLLYYVNNQLDKNRQLLTNHLGLLGSCFSVLAYAAPLSAMGDVISNKSTSSMNFTLSVANFIVGLEWTVYGRFLNDIFIMGPNILGTLVSIVQLSLFWIYPNKPAELLPTTEPKVSQL